MSLFGGNQPQANTSMFGNTAPKPSLFGAPATATQPSTSTSTLFSGQTQQPTTTSTGATSAFGGSAFGASAAPQQPSGSMFGNLQKPQNTLGSTFGQPQQQQQGSAFGLSLQKPQGSLFSGAQQQTQQPAGGLGGLGGLGSNTQQQTNAFGQQQSQFGQNTMTTPQPQQQQPSLSSSLWSPGRAITGVHRTVPMQVAIIKDKWDPPSQSSPFRAYLYNNVGEEAAPFYQPGPEDDESKWEEALRKRPGPGYVPVLVKGFWDLGKRAQRQRDFLTMMQSRLHEINNCLTGLLSKHDLNLSVKIADCRRKHIILSKRCLSLAAKTQILRNRGYAMDEAEEQLKKKLVELERAVFDPSLNGRAEEIWARMLAIHEHSKRLQVEMDRAGVNVTQAEDDIDEQTLKTAKKILDDYHSQIQHLQKEMESIKKDFNEVEKAIGN
ncbi:Nucleoporin Nup54 [Penicillium italicum]|uniref:Nucleoporin Nup54 n=1 Tax=Penicillium italicum TaxID=40296 RepID=A0A0A2KY11_PENIT|nr:Nucleoporin Nup54 [Penicillium italicum]